MSEALVTPAPRSRASEVSFVVKGSPLSFNHAQKHRIIAPRGKPAFVSRYTTPEGVAFKFEVARLAALARPPDWDRDNEYIVECVWYFDTWRPDVDGPGKLVLDSLGEFELEHPRGRVNAFTGFYKNDRQVWTFTQRREKDADYPRAEITVKMRRPWKPLQAALL